jgi:hypothetical protein
MTATATTLPPELARHLPDPALELLLDALAAAEREFERTVHGLTERGNPYAFGGLRRHVCQGLFALVRHFRPRQMVETGVCNGVSTAVLLTALERNGEGHLYSVDLPEHTDTTYPPGTFWEGKLGAVVPRDRPPGWLVPTHLRARWTLQLGRSQEVLPPLLASLGAIDAFLHDSEHSYQCMEFEYRLAWQYLTPGGVLISDDITWNQAFTDFAAAVGRSPLFIDRKVAYLVK